MRAREVDPKAYNETRRARRAAGEIDCSGRLLPKGQRLKGISTLRNGARATVAEWEKTERESHEPPTVPIIPEGFTIDRISSHVDGQGQVRGQHISVERGEADRFESFKAAVASACAEVARAKPARDPHVDLSPDLLEVYPLGDPHIGMLAWAPESGDDFDLKIAEEELTTAVDLLVEQARPAHTALLVNVGDFFHADDDTQLTPGHGHKLSVDSRSPKITAVGFRIMRRLMTKHQKVVVWNLRGNHDPQMGLMVRFWLEAVFENEPRVVIEPNAAAYNHFRFGKVLLAGAHGHLCKAAELPLIMATDWPDDWGASEYRLWITGHIHHETCKEFPGVNVETFNTLAPKDAYNATRYRSRQCLSALTFHRTYGEIGRRTVDRKLARARLDGAL
jgi:UDP-2,3-diacylglucosamine pyrophosphatase LpxH